MKGRIFSIEEFATFDGPGIRTTVFLKGCPLRCTWCHNPEGQRMETEYIRSPNGCLGCGACLRTAVRGTDGMRLTAAAVNDCPRGLVRQCGEELTPEELTAKLLLNAGILNANGGGVTFSGGEPLMQPGFLSECLTLLDGRLHRALQTSGYADGDIFSSVLGKCDFLLFDLKLADPEQHRKFCGTDNARILGNYRLLAASGVPFVTRIPLIPGVTDTDENLGAIAGIISSAGVNYAEVLPYNRMAGGKYAGLLRKYEPGFDGERDVNAGERIFADHGITVKKM